MNTRTRLLSVVLVACCCLSGGRAQADDYPPFYHDLMRHGTWLTVADAWVWQPPVVRTVAGWRPYFHGGNWQFEDGNWFWASDYAWGATTFHYGRWYEAPGRGWVWVPGSDWAPAWVTWRVTDDVCGWAPLPPGQEFFARVAGGDGKAAFELSWSHFSFVPRRRFMARSLDGYAMDASTCGRAAREVAYGPEPASVGLSLNFSSSGFGVNVGFSTPRLYAPSTVYVPPPVAYVPPAVCLPPPPRIFVPPVVRWPVPIRKEWEHPRFGEPIKPDMVNPRFPGGGPDFRGKPEYQGGPDFRGKPGFKGDTEGKGGPGFKEGPGDYKGRDYKGRDFKDGEAKGRDDFKG